MDDEQPDLRILGKRRGLDRPYALLWHLLDTAAVALALWDHYLTARQRVAIACRLGVDEQQARQLIAFWAGLHDIGKATAAFQYKLGDALEILTADEQYPDNGERRLGHDIASEYAAAPLLAALGYPQHKGFWLSGAACRVAQILGAHHGRYNDITEQDSAAEAATHARLGGLGWKRQREALFAAVYEVVGRPKPPVEPEPYEPAVAAEAAMIITGVVVLADWLASQEHFIASQQRSQADKASPEAVRAHFERAVARAPELLLEAGLGSPRVRDASFADVFGFNPNPLQASILDELLGRITGAGLLVVTAATGGGKTEVGFIAAQALGKASGADGMYFALPTMATANEMYKRLTAFISKVATGPAPVTLLHSMSWLNEEYTARAAAHIADPVAISSDERDVVALASAWLRGHRRGMLAPYAVGTIDQSLLAALAVKHNALRMLGLAGKVLVVDEAHAYDAYMQALLRRLLTWLGKLGCPVVLLSATLPSAVSTSLVEAYLRGTGRDGVGGAGYRVEYPGWLFVPADRTQAPVRISPRAREAVVAYRRLTLQIDVRPVNHAQGDDDANDATAPRDRLTVIRDLLGRIRTDGGCAAVMCNTVTDAQTTFLALRDWRDDGVQVELLHSRYPARQREEISQRITGALGREGRRPAKSVVVGTQIIEQSLDLDFDLVVSDLAPIAQLLQRAGRCHRHPRARRPSWLAHPRLVVLDPQDADAGHVKPRRWGAVYDSDLLRATHLLLAERAGRPVVVPDDVQELVEGVYESFLDDEVLMQDRITRKGDEMAQHAMADLVAIPPPEDVYDLAMLSKKQVQEADAVTRLGADSVRVLCCYVDSEGRRWLDAECRRPLPERGSHADGRFTQDEVRQILAETIPVRADEVWDREPENAVPAAWLRNPWLRDLVLLPHLLTPAGVDPGRVGPRKMKLDSEIGLWLR